MGKAHYGAMPHRQGGGNKGVAPKVVPDGNDNTSDGGGHSELEGAAKGIYRKASSGNGGGDPAMKTR